MTWNVLFDVRRLITLTFVIIVTQGIAWQDMCYISTLPTLPELGYSSDTRFMDKVTERRHQHAELCNLLATEGYAVMLIPIVLGIAGLLPKCLDRATKEMDSPNPRKRKV